MATTRIPLTFAACLLAAAAAAPAASAAGKRTVTCKGSGNRCTATVGLAGGASNERLTIRLTDTDLQLASVKASPRAIRGAYDLSHGHFRLGGSEYVVTLNAVQSIGRRGKLTFTFAAKATQRCGRVDVHLDGATIRTERVRATNVPCDTAARLIRQCISATGPGGWRATETGQQVTLQRRDERVEFRLVSRGQTCVPS